MTYWPVFVFLVFGGIYGAGIAIKADRENVLASLRWGYGILGVLSFVVVNSIGYGPNETDTAVAAFLFFTFCGGTILSVIIYIFRLGMKLGE
ncbi:hypothetical protein [Vibrio vulnificus]|uniref:hypothetical protein n=1 Tax=Vibrio vulnificus TaxID=672 RepID=UPI001CDC013A|nr:hypothetical protein [Vibrio vulnificus]ELV8711044.1 hypothetical protein [Vibrio vulnificus]MCA3984157.1 hypothetical protein [Vibrio vulnificus]MCR9501725.1 hypothetical protein [Vibrio vulnificus]MCU8391544.1 hypothetical protein [Vibrio vulnificus]MCU8549455.1 hypothetical protein [Vibrio vulnificus]